MNNEQFDIEDLHLVAGSLRQMAMFDGTDEEWIKRYNRVAALLDSIATVLLSDYASICLRRGNNG